MSIPVQITYHGLEPTEAIDSRIHDEVEKLQRFFEHITSMRVTVEAPHAHHHKGKLYAARIDVSVPGREIVVSRDHHDKHEHEDLYVAIRDAFAAARRQLEDYARKRQGKVKNHRIETG